MFTPKGSANKKRSNIIDFHYFGSSGRKSEFDFQYGGYHDDDRSSKISGESCDTGSEESFPEPNPFDPADDGGLPCVARFLDNNRAAAFLEQAPQ